MTDYAAGTVAVATVRGVPNVRIFRIVQRDEYDTYNWALAQEVKEMRILPDHDVTDVRPLIVLDLNLAIRHMSGGMGDLPEVLKDMRRGGGIFAERIADQIEAQAKPPRIPEPGLWGIVEALVDGVGRPRTWMRMKPNEAGNDWASTDGWHRVWSDLTDPVLIRPGIEDES